MSRSLNVLKTLDCDWISYTPAANEVAAEIFNRGVRSGISKLPDKTVIHNALLAFDLKLVHEELLTVKNCLFEDDRELTAVLAEPPPKRVFANRALFFFNGNGNICVSALFTSYTEDYEILDQRLSIALISEDNRRSQDILNINASIKTGQIEDHLNHLYAVICHH